MKPIKFYYGKMLAIPISKDIIEGVVRVIPIHQKRSDFDKSNRNPRKPCAIQSVQYRQWAPVQLMEFIETLEKAFG